MNTDLESKIAAGLEPQEPVSAERLRGLEERAWEKLEDRRIRRGRTRKGLLIGGLVVFLGVGVAFGSGAVRADQVGHDVVVAVHQFLRDIHECIFGMPITPQRPPR